MKKSGLIQWMMALCIGLIAGGAMGVGCGTPEDTADTGKCTTNIDCTVKGETCNTKTSTCECGVDATTNVDSCTALDEGTFCKLTADKTQKCTKTCAADADCAKGESCSTEALAAPKSCGCKPSELASADTCNKADAQTRCHPDKFLCATVCVDDTGCGSGLKCDPDYKTCRLPTKIVPKCDATSQHLNATKTACVTNCTANSCDAATQICSSVTKECTTKPVDTCDAGQTKIDFGGTLVCATTCAAANAQPDACPNTQYCYDGATDYCAAPPAATCAGASSRTAPSAQTRTIWDVTTSVTTDTAKCPGSNINKVSFKVKGYAQTGFEFPAASANGQPPAALALQRFRKTGELLKQGASAFGFFANYTTSSSGKATEFDLVLCVSDSVLPTTTGIFFADSNTYCAEAGNSL